jgi:hypothetical protein
MLKLLCEVPRYNLYYSLTHPFKKELTIEAELAADWSLANNWEAVVRQPGEPTTTYLICCKEEGGKPIPVLASWLLDRHTCGDGQGEVSSCCRWAETGVWEGEAHGWTLQSIGEWNNGERRRLGRKVGSEWLEEWEVDYAIYTDLSKGKTCSWKQTWRDI